MTLFNHLFGSKRKTAKRIEMADEERIRLWEQHLLDYPEREELAKQFSFKNVDSIMADPAALDKAMDRIEATISADLVHIKDEERLDREILAELIDLRDNDNSEKLNKDIVYEKQSQAALIALFRRIHRVLKAELHAIRLVRKKPANLKEVLLALFKVIFFKESELYRVFSERQLVNKEKHKAIKRMAHAVMLEQEFKEALETDEQRFVREMVDKMRDSSKHHYRRLAEDIYLELAELAGAPLGISGDTLAGLRRLETLMKDDSLMYRLVRKKRPRYTDEQVKAVITAFRRSYDFGHFLELEVGFVT